MSKVCLAFAKDVVDIYKKRWEIELLFKQLKQNFPLRYFYGESANAIKIQIGVTLIANLLLMVVQKRIKNRSWSFSGLATMIRITLMYYINCYSFLNNPDKDWEILIRQGKEPPVQLSLFDYGAWFLKKIRNTVFTSIAERIVVGFKL